MARYPVKPLRRNRAAVQPSLSPDLQYRLLRVTRGCPGRRWTTADELAVKLRIDHGTLAAALFECAASGFLRPANGSSRRRLSLTGAGRHRLDQLEQYRQAEILAPAEPVTPSRPDGARRDPPTQSSGEGSCPNNAP